MAVTGTGTMMLKFTASGDAITDFLFVKSVRWIGATTAGHRCSLTDAAGHIFFESEANAANFIDGWAFVNQPAYGITAATMQSGALNIYLSPTGG